MKILMVGDTHGHHHVLWDKLTIAKSLGCSHVFVLGDFGHWPGHDGILFLDLVNEFARAKNIGVFALGGNHEWWPDWNRRMEDPGRVTNQQGFVYVRSNILYAPKVHNWKWDGKRFFVCGGAVSIDKRWRTLGKDYWEEETFAESDLESVKKYAGPNVDYLLTHDASDHTNWGFPLVPDPDSADNRVRIDQAIAHLKPNTHFHGHMHHKYDWVNTASHGQRHSTLTYGLDCDSEDDSFMVLDTDEDKAYWPEDAVARFA